MLISSLNQAHLEADNIEHKQKIEFIRILAIKVNLYTWKNLTLEENIHAQKEIIVNNQNVIAARSGGKGDHFFRFSINSYSFKVPFKRVMLSPSQINLDIVNNNILFS